MQKGANMVAKIFTDQVENGVRFTVLFNDQKDVMDLRKWQVNFFELLSWKNTWGMCYELDIKSNRDDGAFLVVRVNEKVKDRMQDYLESLGYKNIRAEECKVCVMEMDYDENIDYYVAY